MGRFVSASGEGAAEVVGTTLTNTGWQAELENIGATRISQQRVSTAPKMSAGHGIYTCGQVLLVEGRTVTIDWDSYNVPDPLATTWQGCSSTLSGWGWKTSP